MLGELGGTALFGARFRENAARALLIPRRRPGVADPALAAAPEGLVAAAGGPQVRQLPRDPRDLPRVPQRLVRPARSARRADPHPVARAGRRRGGDRHRVAVRRVAAVRVRRVVHVRGRHPGRRAPGPGALAQPRPAARAARPGGAARADRPRSPRDPRGRSAGPLGARPRPRRRRPARPAAPDRRPLGGRDRPARDRAGRRGRVGRGADRRAAGRAASGSAARSG